ncbi:MAG TPA: VCBS repeat-containing protein [Kofleriaceae bacterium]
MRFVVLVMMLVACVHDSYRCHTDSECNAGEAGRCEADGRCTQFDSACALTQRSYVHADTDSGTCFAGQRTPLDYCAPGQAPAEAVGCGAQVCATLPSCCTTAWTEACVVEAQRCTEVTCDTRLAITASRGSAELAVYDARWDGAQWQATARPEFVNYATYLAPAPGSAEPRFAGFRSTSELAIDGEASVELDPSREYHDIASVDFDRDLRDTVVLDWADMVLRQQELTIVKLGMAKQPIDIDTGVSTRMTWGVTQDENGFVDGYPDVVAANANSYKVLANSLDANRERTLTTATNSSYDTNNTAGANGATHTFSWFDLDGDGNLDLVGFGNEIQVQTGVFDGTPVVDIDCNPPMINPTCAPESVAFNGAVLPGPSPTIIAAPFNSPAQSRQLWSITVNPDHTISASQLPVPAPQPACPTCEYEAVIVRDFDGDHQPDILAIDSALTFDMALSSKDPTLHTFVEMHPIPPPMPSLYNSVRVTATGAPR